MIRKLLILLLGSFIIFSCTDQKEHRKQQFLLKGHEAYKKKNFPSAIHYFEEAVTIDSCYAPALNNMATVYYEQGRLDQALHLYERAINCDPSFYQARLNLSNTLYDLKQYYRGVDVLTKQLEQTPDSSDIRFALGLHLTKLREYDSAINSFETVRSAEAGNAEVLVNLGTLHYYKENYPETRDLLQKAIAIDPEEPEAYNTLALVAAAEKEYEKALSYIDQALEIDEEPHYLNNKGYILIKMGKLQQATEIINESIVIDPLNAWAFRNKAIIMLEQERPDEAIELLKRAEKLDDWVEDINYYFGQAWFMKGDREEACKYYLKGAKLKEQRSQVAAETFCGNS